MFCFQLPDISPCDQFSTKWCSSNATGVKTSLFAERLLDALSLSGSPFAFSSCLVYMQGSGRSDRHSPRDSYRQGWALLRAQAGLPTGMDGRQSFKQ